MTKLSIQQFLEQVDLHLQTGKLAMAESLLGEVSEENRQHPVFLQRIAALHFLKKDFPRSAQLYLELAEADSKNSGHFINAILSLQNCGEEARARETAELAVRSLPDQAAIYPVITRLYIRQRRYEQARRFASSALEKFPNEVELLQLRADACYESQFEDYGLQDLLTCLNSNIETDKDKALNLYTRLFRTYYALGNETQFLEYLNKADEIQTTSLEHLYLQLDFYEKANDLEKMDQVLSRAEQVHSDDFGLQFYRCIYFNRSKRMTEFFDLAKSLCKLDTEKLDFKMRLNSLLGRAYEKQQDYGKAYACFEEMNRTTIAIHGGPESNQSLAARKTRTVEMWRELIPSLADQFNSLDHSSDGNKPVFLVGFPRSGTTMVDQILSSHPEIEVLEEKPVLAKVMQSFEQRVGTAQLEKILTLTEKETESMRHQYQEVLAKFKVTDKPLTIDKLPLNIVHLPLILKMFPNAKILVALRHPLDSVFSCFAQAFGYNASMAHFVSISSAASYYHEVMTNFLEIQHRYNKEFLTFRYEDLVEDLRKQVERIFSYLEVEWEESALSFHETARNRRIINTPSYNQVTQPLYASSVNKWRHYEEYMSSAKEKLQEFVAAFGYEKE